MSSVIIYIIELHVQLQQKLLEEDPAKNTQKPDAEFLESFSSVVGREWPSLAASLSMSEEDIQEVKGKGEELSHQARALQMLEKWVSSDDASYSKLCQTLKTIQLF